MREGGREGREREEDASSQVTCTLATSVLATLHSKHDHSGLGKDAVQILSVWSIRLPFRKIQSVLAQHPFLQNRLIFLKG